MLVKDLSLVLKGDQKVEIDGRIIWARDLMGRHSDYSGRVVNKIWADQSAAVGNQEFIHIELRR